MLTTIFEHINFGIIILSTFTIIIGLLIIRLNNDNKNRDTKLVKFIIILIIITNIYLPYHTYKVKNENIAIFLNNDSLICSNYIQTYKINKSNDWKLEDNYFTKNSILFKVVTCKKFDN